MKWKSQLIACSSLPRCSLASMPSHSGNLLHRDSNHLDSAGSELDHDVDDYDCNTACCRWDCEQTRQVWTACSTIQIEPKPWRKLNSANKKDKMPGMKLIYFHIGIHKSICQQKRVDKIWAMMTTTTLIGNVDNIHKLDKSWHSNLHRSTRNTYRGVSWYMCFW